MNTVVYIHNQVYQNSFIQFSDIYPQRQIYYISISPFCTTKSKYNSLQQFLIAKSAATHTCGLFLNFGMIRECYPAVLNLVLINSIRMFFCRFAHFLNKFKKYNSKPCWYQLRNFEHSLGAAANRPINPHKSIDKSSSFPS